MLSLNFLSDALMAIAFVIIPVSFVFAIGKQEGLNRQFKTASVLYALGMLSVALTFVLPHLFPGMNGTAYEFAAKLISASAILAASFVSWPLIRAATLHTRLLASLSDTQLLLLERDDLTAAKTELEKEIVIGSYKLERVNRQMRLALQGSPITMFRQDKDLRYTWIFNVPEKTQESDFIGRTDKEVFPPDTALIVADIKNLAMESNEEQSAETRVRFPHGNLWYFLRTQPDYDVDGNIIGTISCAIDITEQKRQQQRLVLLMREVTHRSKNLLAVLQSIIRQTALRTRNIDEFVVRLMARLHSIARSHDLLVNDDWSGTSLKSLLASQLAVLSEVEPDRIRVEGGDMLLTSVAVQNLGLAVHELASNAIKYGSLSEDGKGTVQMNWVVVGADGADASGGATDEVRLVWSESNGPPVDPSPESGFGRMLLERVVGQALGGTVDMNFAPSGLVCSMRFPVSRVVAEAEEAASIPAAAAKSILQV